MSGEPLGNKSIGEFRIAGDCLAKLGRPWEIDLVRSRQISSPFLTFGRPILPDRHADEMPQKTVLIPSREEPDTENLQFDRSDRRSVHAVHAAGS